jgi:hypothetical protein
LKLQKVAQETPWATVIGDNCIGLSLNGRCPVNENNKPSNALSDLALERVMQDVLSGIWEISPERAQQEITKADSSQSNGGEESEA